MTFWRTATGLALGALTALVATPATGQEPPRPDRPVRMVLASSKIPVVGGAALHLRLLRVTIPAGQSITYTGPHGMVYPLSGSFAVSTDGDRRTLQDGEGAYVVAGRPAMLSAGPSAPAVLLHYLLVAAADLDSVFHSRPASASEVYRTKDPLPGLKPGPYEFTLTRVTVNPKIPPPPLHHRSGAALYYVLSGTWTIHTEDRKEPRGRGVTQFEPNTFVHTWENVGETAGALLQANISPEGTPEIIFVKRP